MRPRRGAPPEPVVIERPRRPTAEPEPTPSFIRPVRPRRPEPVEVEIQRPVRPQRPVPQTKEHPHGGYTPCPPARCQHRVQFEGEATFYVNNITCVSGCNDPDCNAYSILIEGQKIRIKLLNTEKLVGDCPYCKAPLKEVSKDHVTYTYTCGTTGDRIAQTYTRICKPPTTIRRARR